ncbi:hypothetical protein CEY16_00250 [Halalkalibacillus sediminis]|uniref:PrkA AAA domain-containing protein n=1 Tax=Halalkalibacillus sediminis TaxID=2018042 RepID=A0A2I0QV69_9BACI|nr:hypothetical protein [Halalkalibacillus sediminis]PKR78225.1 hypothetical protein CEY16_00250 [Halalkalibacillus sediminis]
MRDSYSLKEYVQMILDKKFIPLTSHQRLWNALVKNDSLLKDPVLSNADFFKKTIDEYFRPAGKGYDVRKRMLVLVGPPGSGKSTFVQKLKESIIVYSYTDEGAVFRIKGCALNEDPLLAVPEAIRSKIRQCGIEVRGQLSTYNQYRLQQFQGEWENVQIERFYLSEAKRQGIGHFFPGDHYSQDQSDLLGSIDYSTITKYGSPSHPMAYRYDGEIQAANRGILELNEVFKCQRQLLYPFISLSEEGSYKISRQSPLCADEVVIGHTNETDLEDFIKEKNNEALTSRMVFIRVPYNLVLSNEIILYQEKLLNHDVSRLQYQALETLAMAVLLTRVKRSNQFPVTKMEKVMLYNGEKVEGFSRDDLTEEYQDEGMSGIEPRMVFNLLAKVCARDTDQIDAELLLEELEISLKNDYVLPLQEREKFLNAIEQARAYYHTKLYDLVLDFIEDEKMSDLDQNVQRYFQELSSETSFSKSVDSLMEMNLKHNRDSLREWLEDDLDNIRYSDLPDDYQRIFKRFTLKQIQVTEENFREQLYEYGLQQWKNKSIFVSDSMLDTIDQLMRSE